MKRREFLRTAGGAAGVATAASATASSAAADGGVSAIQEGGNATQPGGNQTAGGNQTDGGNQTEGGNQSGGGELSGAGEETTVIVGPGGDYVFDPENIEILPGTTVIWEWDSAGHNVNPTSIPDGAEWEGHPDVVASGPYQHTFTTEGTYDYECTPHRGSGMLGSVNVTPDANAGGGGYEPPDPSHMGIPVQKHFVGAISFMGIFVSLVFTFYLLKYGESAHTAAPNKKD